MIITFYSFQVWFKTLPVVCFIQISSFIHNLFYLVVYDKMFLIWIRSTFRNF